MASVESINAALNEVLTSSENITLNGVFSQLMAASFIEWVTKDNRGQNLGLFLDDEHVKTVVLDTTATGVLKVRDERADKTTLRKPTGAKTLTDASEQIIALVKEVAPLRGEQLRGKIRLAFVPKPTE